MRTGSEFYCRLAWTVEASLHEDVALEVPQPKWPRYISISLLYLGSTGTNHFIGCSISATVIAMKTCLCILLTGVLIFLS